MLSTGRPRSTRSTRPYAKAAKSGPAQGRARATPTTPSCRPTSSADPHSCTFDAPLTMAMGSWSRSSAGTTTSGATPTAWSTSCRSPGPGRQAQAVSLPVSPIPRLEDLERPSAASTASASSCAPTSTSRSTADGASPTTSASAPRCRRSSGCASGAPSRHRAATSVGPRARRTRSTRWTRCGPAWPSSRPASSCSRTCGSTPARRATTRPSSAALCDGIDGYVNDAFGASHRAHASIVGPPRSLPVRGRAAPRSKEVDVLLGLRNAPERPFVAILGGAKVSDKLGVIEALLDKVDALRHRRWDVLHVPRRPGPAASATRCSSPTRSTPAGRSSKAPTKPIHLPTDITGLGPTATTFADVGHGACPTVPRASTSVRARPPSSPTS